MDRLVRILWRWSLLLVFLVALAAACEDLLLRYQMKRGGPGAVFEQASVYDAAENKGGRVEIYFDHPETRECVHAIFPHFGDAPCWYVKRHPVKLLSKLQEFFDNAQRLSIRARRGRRGWIQAGRSS